MTKPRPLVAGNWKMNGLRAADNELEAIITGLDAKPAAADALICPPATLIIPFAALAKGSRVSIGAQDCHADAAGAHTGDISAEILADAGATHVIVGHSERRTDHAERDADVKAKAEAALRTGLTAIVCIGETKEERDAGKTLDIVKRQLHGSLPAEADWATIIIAYEPVWAIGTGVTPTTSQVAEVHGFIREELGHLVKRDADQVRILYGGSVKPSNAAELMAIENVDGALVGGASLLAPDFLGIIGIYRE